MQRGLTALLAAVGILAVGCGNDVVGELSVFNTRLLNGMYLDNPVN